MPVRAASFTANVLWSALGAALLALGPVRTSAQTAPRLVRVEGVAFDSLANRPLADAFVAVAGTGRSAISDNKGRFRLDGVPEGEYTLTMQHAAFDSLGLSGASVRVAVRNRMPRVVLAVPSFATLWRAACGAAELPRDGSLLYGTLRDATTNEPLGARVMEGVWTELVGGGRTMASVGQRRWRLSTVTDERGEYALCGVAIGTPITLRVPRDTSASASTDSIEAPASMTRVRRQDMLAATAAPRSVLDSATAGEDSTQTTPVPHATARPSVTGVIAGIVTNASGTPVANAAVAVDTLPEVRTNDEGRFFVREVAAGSRQVAVVAIGLQPTTTTVNLLAGDTARLTIPLSGVQTLGAVDVRATVISTRTRGIEERKRTGFGAFRDSTELIRYPAFSSVLATVPGASIRRGLASLVFGQGASLCSGEQIDWRIDGHPALPEVVEGLDLKSIATVEVYRRVNQLPAELMTNIRYRCAVLVWTKLGLGR